MDREKLIEAIGTAIDNAPNLWVHEVSEDEWHVCYWSEKTLGEKRKWVVVREAASEDEAAKKMREEVTRMRAEAALAAIESCGFSLIPTANIQQVLEIVSEMKNENARALRDHVKGTSSPSNKEREDG